MASTTSTPAAVTTGTSVRNKTTNYYNTKVITLANGSLQRETYRTDVSGNNGVLIQKLSVDNTGKIISKETTSNTTSLEKAALENPNSQLRKSIKSQVNDAKKKLGSDANSDGATNKSFDVASGGSGNSATGTETGDPQGVPINQDQLLKEIADKSGGVREKYPTLLTYPITRSPKQDYIKFAMYRYSAKKVLSGNGGDEFGKRINSREDVKNILGTVTLPIQPSISDNNIVNWGEDPLNSIQSGGAQLSLQLMAGNTEAAQKTVNEGLSDTSSIKSLIMSAAAGAAVGTNGGNLLTRLSGAIINPNLELLFKGPSLRSFTFTFSLSAREEKEAQEIRKIIRFFKQGMSVKRASTSLFLKSPNTFGISYWNAGKEHPWMNKIKECALQNFSVNYTPAGNYATYEDGAMTQYDLTLTFNELDPIYDDDYLEDGDTTIGY